MTQDQNTVLDEKAILPCPFCGEAEHLYPAYRLNKDGTCIEPPYAIDCLGCGTDFTPRDGQDARAAWNRRDLASLPSTGVKPYGYANLYRDEDGDFLLGGVDLYPTPEPEWGEFADDYVGPVSIWPASVSITPSVDPAGMGLVEEAKISVSELDAWFPRGVPIVAVKVLSPEKSLPLTTAELRHVLAALASIAPQGGGGAE